MSAKYPQQQRCRYRGFVILLALALCFTGAVNTAHAAVPTPTVVTAPTDWWSVQWGFRLSLQVAANGYLRRDQPVEVPLNFTTMLTAHGQHGAFDPASLQLIEVGDHGIGNDSIPFQFDQASDYDATTNAAGTLTFLLTGTTAADATRTFELYFDEVGKAFTPATFADHVSVTTVEDEGQSAFQVQTDLATYYYQKEAGGFSSLVDAAGNDWINYHAAPTNSAGGAYRGIPNLVHPEGKLHPGATGHITTLLHRGPLKATLHTVLKTDDSAAWEVLWEFFPGFARMAVLQADHDYWFLYEGTPGGSFDPTRDFVVRADGVQSTADIAWTGDLPDEEWLYFADPDANRALYLVNHTEDELVDSYRPMSDSGGAMTVFGFGRQNSRHYFTQTNQIFTIGLMDEIAYEMGARHIRGIYRPLLVTLGEVEALDAIIVENGEPTGTAHIEPSEYSYQLYLPMLRS